MMQRVVIVGAGIVGISLAHAIAERGAVDVTVLERNDREPHGSTAYAPGFVGLYNDVPILTELAIESAGIYDRVGIGFYRTGGLELATTEAAASELVRRVDSAQSAGLGAAMTSPSDLPESVTSFVDTTKIAAVGSFTQDGSADVRILTRRLRDEAESRGVRFLYRQEVTEIAEHASGVMVRSSTGDLFTSDAVMLAVGVWGPSIAQLTGLELPLFPVAHPYVYGPSGASLVPGPFVRWPEHHVYARIHSDHLGLGTYDHEPIAVEQAELTAGAALPWRASFALAIENAQALLRSEARFIPDCRINGVFAMTPDNLPFLGAHPTMSNVWVAQAIWVTHAAGAAARLVDALLTGGSLPIQLSVDRFSGSEMSHLRAGALRLYRDIYANDVG